MSDEEQEVLSLEDLDDETSQEESVEEDQTEEAEQAEDKHEFDKDRQREQQELANSKRYIAELEQKVNAAGSKSPKEDKNDDDDPLETIADLKKRQGQLEGLLQQTAAQVSYSKEQESYHSHLSAMDAEHGTELRNEALRIASEKAIARGYSLEGQDCPQLKERHDLIEMGYLAAAKAAGKKPAPKASRAKADTGRSGKAAQDSDVFRGSPDDVLEDMRNRGKFSGILTTK